MVERALETEPLKTLIMMKAIKTAGLSDMFQEAQALQAPASQPGVPGIASEGMMQMPVGPGVGRGIVEGQELGGGAGGPPARQGGRPAGSGQQPGGFKGSPLDMG